MMIPHLCPELPAPQREALALQVKSPILYTSVALRNWQAWKKLGIGAAIAPTGYHINAMLDFPVSLGSYRFAEEPDDPIVVHMERFPHRSNMGLTPRVQHRLGRYELLSTTFETLERNVRGQLAGMLSAGGFDPARDIEGITVNRWAHGYARWYNPLFESYYYEDRDDERYPHVQARKRFGRIAIANSDAGARAMFEAAVEQGHRAAAELS
jgi:spermidine dehydrogenase